MNIIGPSGSPNGFALQRQNSLFVQETVFQKSAILSGLVSPAQLDYVERLARHRNRISDGGKTGEDAAIQAVSDSSPERTAEQIHDRLLADLLIEQKILTAYQASQLALGRTKLNLGPYVITDFIGQGGMGQVFKGTHRVMGRECAVKVLPLDRATDETRQSFAREIRMQARLDCPYLVRAYDAGQDGSVHFLVTEYVPGMDLRRLIRVQGPLKTHHAANVIMQAALGLEHAHAAGLVHRDIKPGNIIVTPDGIAKVTDIGLAGFSSNLIDDPRAGKIVGTLDYLSPEQIRTPLEVNAASDIYSLGCTLYYAVCGKVPFPGGDTRSKIRRHLEETPWHPRKFASELSEDFVDIIADMMAKKPTERITSAAEVAARLEPWASGIEEIALQQLTKTAWLPPPPPNETEVRTADQSSYEAASDIAESYSLANTTTAVDSQIDSDGALRLGSQTSLSGDLPGNLASLSAVSSDTSSLTLADDPRSERSSDGAESPVLRQYSLPMLIALTLAITIPPVLLIGAIIGFLVRGSL
jgi:serine/threonine protein kinase